MHAFGTGSAASGEGQPDSRGSAEAHFTGTPGTFSWRVSKRREIFTSECHCTAVSGNVNRTTRTAIREPTHIVVIEYVPGGRRCDVVFAAGDNCPVRVNINRPSNTVTLFTLSFRRRCYNNVVRLYL